MATYETRARFGAVTFPTKASDSRDGFTGDPSLRIFANYLKAYINKYVLPLWSTTFHPDVDPLPVKEVLPDDPYEGVSVQDLPALYVYRQVYQGQAMQTAIDLEIVPSQFTIVWIPPIEINEERKIKTGFANAVAKCIYSAVQKGMDPVFQVEGFEHEEGTFIYRTELMNVYTIRVSEGKWSKIDIHMAPVVDDNGNSQDNIAQYPCLFVNINIEEMYERGITDDPELPNDEYDYNLGMGLTIDHGDDITDADRLLIPPARGTLQKCYEKYNRFEWYRILIRILTKTAILVVWFLLNLFKA